MYSHHDELFIVFGGGCFGTHHVRHIEKGRKRGRISPAARIIMLDRNTRPPALDLPEVVDNPFLSFVQSDWLDYMKSNWDILPPRTEAVPAPVAPHLAFEWLVWSLREKLGSSAVSIEPVEHSFKGLPYDYLAPSGARFISAADWICPTNCRAPHICPMTRDIRTWDLERSVKEYAAAYPQELSTAIVFQPRFRVPGIDTLRIEEYTEARDQLIALAEHAQQSGQHSPGVVVGTVSPCHGAVSILRLNSLHAQMPGRPTP